MNRKLSRLIFLVKEDIGLFLSTSFGVFLFVLFFQPFSLEKLDLNNALLFVAGLGAIVFIFMYLMRLLSVRHEKRKEPEKHDSSLGYFVSMLVVLSLNSTAFAFYLLYVGGVSITFHIMFKVVLISIVPIIVLRLSDEFKFLRKENELLIKERKELINKVDEYKEDYLNRSIEFISENNGDNLSLQLADVAFLKSADNYVEVVYKEADIFKRTLIRNTLRNVEQQLTPFENFFRCHRTCIVNRFFVEKLHRKFNSYSLNIKGIDEILPVSRQYLLRVKELV